MDNNPNGYSPNYDLKHLLAAVRIKDAQLPKEKENELYTALTKLKIKEHTPEQIEKGINQILTSINATTIDKLMTEYGVSPEVILPYEPLSDIPNSHVSKDGLLDSINFDFPTHFKPLKKTLINSLPKENGSLIVLGGTDTLEYYSTALDAALNRYDLLSKNNVTFVSSIYTFEKHPSHVAGLLKGALETARRPSKDENKPILNGAYVLSPELEPNHDVKAVKLHDISKGIVKVSSRLKDAFRSNDGIVNRIELNNGKAIHHPNHENLAFKRETLKPAVHNANVAPQLIKGNSPRIVLAYLNKILDMSLKGKTPFDFVTIENPQLIVNSSLSFEILKTISALSTNNIHVAFFQDIAPESQAHPEFKPVNKQPLSKNSNYIKQLENLGCIFETGPSTKLYNDLRFRESTPLRKIETLQSADSTHSAYVSKPLNEPIKIKYIPNQILFKEMLKVSSEVSDHIVIEGLPGQALPDYYLDTVQQLIANGTQVTLGFKYNGQKYTEGEESFVEGHDTTHHYAASRWLDNSDVKFCGETPPAEIGIENQKSL